MGPMRVLVVTPWFPSERAPGSGVFNLRDARLIAEHHDVTVLHLIRPEHASDTETDPADLSVIRVPYSFERPWTILPAARRIRRLLRDFDAVHSMAFPGLLPVRLARPRMPWLHTEHYSQLVTPPSSPRMALSLAVLKPLFRRPTRTIAVSRALAAVIDRYRRTPTRVIGNEVMMPVEPLPPRPDALSEGVAVRLIGVGTLIERKGPVTAVETMVELRSRGVDASLTWVGGGPLADQMRATAERAGAGESLRLTGHLDPDALSRELSTADLFLLPVETETFGVAIAEAFAHGLPVVTTGSGGHVEFLPDEASRLVESRTAQPLADAVQELSTAPDLWSRDRISAYARDRFSHEARAEAYRAAYAGLE